jgi:D-glycero-D-manno-heptose 1,7-bisphosphate phosphatase
MVEPRMASWPLIPPGIWFQQSSRPLSDTRPALFLDRDGTVIEQVEYIHRAEDVMLHEGAGDLIAASNRAGIPVVLVVNQSGVSRGLYDWTGFAVVQAKLQKLLAEFEARLDAVVACPFHPEFTPGWGSEHAAWRKPGPNMIVHAAQALHLECSASWMVGDTASDLEAARSAGLKGGIHVLTGHGHRERARAAALARPGFAVVPVENIAAAGVFLATLAAFAELTL